MPHEIQFENPERSDEHQATIDRAVDSLADVVFLHHESSFALRMMAAAVTMWTKHEHALNSCEDNPGGCPHMAELAARLSYELASAFAHGYYGTGEQFAVVKAAAIAAAISSELLAKQVPAAPEAVTPQEVLRMVADDLDLAEAQTETSWQDVKGTMLNQLENEQLEMQFNPPERRSEDVINMLTGERGEPFEPRVISFDEAPEALKEMLRELGLIPAEPEPDEEG